jgi:aspartate carbamoyltransferase catalytic subunit
MYNINNSKINILKTIPARVKINSPSTLQPYNDIHGKVGISIPKIIDDSYIRVMFTEGNIRSQMINIIYLDIV